MRVPFDADAIRMLAALLLETGLTEIEISDKDFRVRVAKAPAPVITSVMAGGVAPAAAPDTTRAAPPAAGPGADQPLAGVVPSPMVGIAYLSAEPGSPPYVSVGQTVTAGQTLLLIEAMKTFNQIKAPRAGTITRVLVQTGAPVEFGEPLLTIE